MPCPSWEVGLGRQPKATWLRPHQSQLESPGCHTSHWLSSTAGEQTQVVQLSEGAGRNPTSQSLDEDAGGAREDSSKIPRWQGLGLG